MKNKPTNSLTQAAGPAPYTGEWTERTAAHLLRRATFGPTAAELRAAHDRGLRATLDELLRPGAPVAPPVNYVFRGDPAIPVGTTWVDKPYGPHDNENYRVQSLVGWYFNNVLDRQRGLREKMNLFWINHFGMTDVIDHRAQYRYVALFYELATGNFRELMERITVEPAMLQFLDGEVNNKENPNENYARELLELYTIQKGPQIGEGDYSNYTEQDVAALARVLTGWRNQPFPFRSDDTPVASYFDSRNHDTGDKQLSYHFNHAVIRDEGPAEYKTLIRIILDQAETARGICRELYRWFVYSEITPQAEAEVIEPLAAALRANDYEVAPALRLLLGSQHFFDMSVRGPMIKNPYEYMFSIVRPLGGFGHLDLTLKQEYGAGAKLGTLGEVMGMSYLFLPTVSGWRAYYDSPGFGRNWISPTTLQRRRNFSDDVTSGGFFAFDQLLPVDWTTFLHGFRNPGDVTALVGQLVTLLLPRALHPDQLAALGDQLVEGLPATEWTALVLAQRAEPLNDQLKRTVTSKLRRLLRAIFNLPEFQLQ